ncbi:hypothetical protein IAD21_04222 [Abditibacteriota bacterium]|nr:hypothetical protein IAD21_04222 [Abditibacteriota bacterium]
MTYFKFFSLFLLGLMFLPSVSVRAQQTDDGKNPEVAGFALITSIDKASYKPTEPIILDMKLKNQRTTNVAYWTGSPFSIFNISVTAPNGAPASLTEYGKQKMGPITGSHFGRILKPGDEITGQFLLNRLYDMTLSGKYKISVVCDIPAQDEPNKWVKIASKTTTIVVEP